MAEVKVLLEGYSKEENGKVKANCTVTLIKSKHNTIVDTGVTGDWMKISNELAKENLTQFDIQFVVYTHGHSDHIGNIGMFVNAKVISFESMNEKDMFEFFEDEFEIDDEVKVVKTPGHSGQDISVFVKSPNGLIVVAGDCFENENDDEKSELAKPWSHDWKTHLKSRREILEVANYIVPGHGKMFKVNR